MVRLRITFSLVQASRFTGQFATFAPRTYHSKTNFVSQSYCTSPKVPMEKMIDVDGQSINYVQVGDGGHALLCQNGALGYIESDFGPHLNGLLSKKYTLVAWDPPGYGKSRPPDRDFDGLKFYTSDAQISYKLMKKLGIAKFSVLGWSDGGITGMIQASMFPEAVDKLVIWGANAFVAKHDIDLYLKLFGDFSKWSPRMAEPLVKVYGETYTKSMLKDFCDAFVDCYKNNEGDICKGHLSKIKSPTLIIHGVKDPIVGMEHPEYLHKNISNSQLFLMPDGKHNLHLRYAEEFSIIVDKFLNGESLQ